MVARCIRTTGEDLDLRILSEYMVPGARRVDKIIHRRQRHRAKRVKSEPQEVLLRGKQRRKAREKSEQEARDTGSRFRVHKVKGQDHSEEKTKLNNVKCHQKCKWNHIGKKLTLETSASAT